MPRKTVWDYREVERAARLHEKASDAERALGSNTATVNKALRTDDEFRAAWNRGREASGFRLYKPRGAEANGDGHVAKPQLSDLEQEVLETLEANDGMRVDELVDATRQTRIEVSNAIRALGRHSLIRAEGDKYFANGPADPIPQPARARRAANTPPPQIQGQTAEGRRQETSVPGFKSQAASRGAERRDEWSFGGRLGAAPGAGARRAALSAGAW